ncbi:MAG TPA: hydrogenase maturation protease [Baekduia sp.]|jgi:hydrogenase maturation protease|uniref:hydrogenase maturation protease n=1 Tax=Baekduia sp. TaxID=2600305 RepID=UPI002BBFCCD3|nr:hydrogenase maturation protease [Baekduia sp.]HMJ32644.1 hydrogenase maturation protease [Baekduia sp.]
MTPQLEKQILIAGVGNAWLQDDAFGAECARRLEARGLPSGVTVMDFGTGGLDLAYEIMRGYDALVLLDASRQGNEPGTLYVLEPLMEDLSGPIEDGDVINPHGMDPQTVLRFVGAIGGFSGRVVVIGCEPGEVDDVGLGLTPAVEGAVERALQLVGETIDELRTDAAYQR